MPVYPSNGVSVKDFPTCALGVVSKWEPATKYREEEEIPSETGTLKYIVGVDSMTEVEVELVMYPGQVIPSALTSVTFSSGSYLIRGDVKNAGNAGKASRVQFKAISNSLLP